jgi:hypothetical protein
MLSADLALFISSNTQDSINLLDIPAQREDTQGINVRSTLQQALDTMNDKELDTLYVKHSKRIKTGSQIKGIITGQTVESLTVIARLFPAVNQWKLALKLIIIKKHYICGGLKYALGSRISYHICGCLVFGLILLASIICLPRDV